MGDVKMGGMLGAFLGLYALLAVFLGALLGAIIAGVLMATGRMGRRTALPFGVFLAVAGVLVAFAGPQIWGSYSELFLAVIGEV
jgi:leader peptidase (prepilin peptidase)/N-methyltransferase